MLATNVTACPNAEGFRLDAIVVVVVPRLTVSVSTAEVLPEKFASPVAFALIECDPTAKLEIESCATLLVGDAVPSAVVPS